LSSDAPAGSPARGPAADDPYAAASGDPYAAAAASAAVLAERTGQRQHDVAIVLGSGWAPAADALASGALASEPLPSGARDATSEHTAGPAGHARSADHGQPAEHATAEVPLADLGGFPPPTVPGHSPVVRSLAIGGHRVLVFLGRTHLYEGHPVQTVVHGVRTAMAAGCRTVVLTNAAGGIRAGYHVGQPVLIRDHLNLTARSPLAGPPPPDGYPSRFTDLTGLYSPRLRELATRADPGLAEGVYAALPGPHYETPAEITMLRGLGADLVGMSTVLEAIAARHLGAEVLAISLVTNLAAGLAPSGLDHQEVIAAGRAASARMGSLLAAILPGIG
jgi:purine-nucleoside phosphorylase